MYMKHNLIEGMNKKSSSIYIPSHTICFIYDSYLPTLLTSYSPPSPPLPIPPQLILYHKLSNSISIPLQQQLQLLRQIFSSMQCLIMQRLYSKSNQKFWIAATPHTHRPHCHRSKTSVKFYASFRSCSLFFRGRKSRKRLFW